MKAGGEEETERKDTTTRYQGIWFRGEKPETKAKRLPADGVEAARIIARAERGVAAIESRDAEIRRAPPPLLISLNYNVMPTGCTASVPKPRLTSPNACTSCTS